MILIFVSFMIFLFIEKPKLLNHTFLGFFMYLGLSVSLNLSFVFLMSFCCKALNNNTSCFWFSFMDYDLKFQKNEPP